MPKRKGSDVVIALRKSPEFKSVSIIMVSGKGEMIFDTRKKDFIWKPNNPAVKDRGSLPAAKGASDLAEAYGVDDYVAKPFSYVCPH